MHLFSLLSALLLLFHTPTFCFSWVSTSVASKGATTSNGNNHPWKHLSIKFDKSAQSSSSLSSSRTTCIQRRLPATTITTLYSSKGSDNHGVESEKDPQSSRLQEEIDRLTKPRDYPLFLAEKAIELLESTLLPKSPSSSPLFRGPQSTPIVKERIVVLGSGWGAASYLKEIDTTLYDVTIISPRNYFLFTPLLAGASVGTVEFRSICEPIQEINPGAAFIEATAVEIDLESSTVTCQKQNNPLFSSSFGDNTDVELEEFDVPFDRLLFTIGAQTNTFGIPGIKEHCTYLRQLEDARRVKAKVANLFERANRPSLTDEQRQALLTVCVIGAGPTGVEFAAELRDFVEQDAPKYYPKLIQHVRIKVIEASSTVLAPFDRALQSEAIKMLNRAVQFQDRSFQESLPKHFKLTELLLEASVEKVNETHIHLQDDTIIPYGLAVWAAGNGPLPLTLQLIEALKDTEQTELQTVARGRLAIDPWMRVRGTRGKVLSLGDCSCIPDNQLPATAQVASQQGEYLAKLMNKKFELSPLSTNEDKTVFLPPTRSVDQTESTTLSDAVANYAMNSTEYAKPFQFLNLGILAYAGGGSALAQVTPAPDLDAIKGTGPLGNLVWRGVYLSKQFSVRNGMLVVNDWAKRQLIGRDISRL